MSRDVPAGLRGRLDEAVPVDPALLTFGIDVFQAVMTGAMPVDEYDGDDLPCLGMSAITR